MFILLKYSCKGTSDEYPQQFSLKNKKSISTDNPVIVSGAMNNNLAFVLYGKVIGMMHVRWLK